MHRIELVLLLLLAAAAAARLRRVLPPKRPWPLWVLCLGYAAWGGLFIRETICRGWNGKPFYCLFDDAMISLRYALHLVRGQGLVWNLGQHVEGFTNPLMTFAMAAALKAFGMVDGILCIQLAGLVLVLLAAWLALEIWTNGFARERSDGLSGERFWILAGILAYYPVSYWSLMGMETGLLTVLLLGAVVLVLKHWGDDRFLPWPPVLLGLAVLCRPDALVQVLIIFAFRFASLRKWPDFRKAAGELLCFAAFPLGYEVFRLAYYHRWLPNTYYLKLTGLALGIRLLGGWNFTREFLASVWPLEVLALAGVFLRFNAKKFLIWSLHLSLILYQIWVGGDPWVYWRIFTPSMPLLVLLAMEGLKNTVWHWKAPELSFRGWDGMDLKYAAVALSLMASFLWADWKFLGEICFTRPPYQVEANRENLKTALLLRNVLEPGAKAGVFWAGTIPYYCEVEAIDCLGKCDSHIASLNADPSLGWAGMISVPGHNKYDLDYSIKTLKPDYIQYDKWGRDDLSAYVEKNYVSYEGRWLLKGSRYVRWNLVDSKTPQVPE